METATVFPPEGPPPENKRSEDFARHYDRRWTGHHAPFGFDHIDELAGSQGIHIHFFLPAGTTRAAFYAAVAKATRARDVVNYSWSWIPTEDACPTE